MKKLIVNFEIRPPAKDEPRKAYNERFDECVTLLEEEMETFGGEVVEQLRQLGYVFVEFEEETQCSEAQEYLEDCDYIKSVLHDTKFENNA